MRPLPIIILLLLAVRGLTGQIGRESAFSIGETLEFSSRVLEEDRVLNIYLPNGYHPDSTKRYPVIYLLDGSRDEDFIHIAGLVQFCSFSWIEIIPESIVVGIGNVDRKRDFTFPTYNEKDKADFPTTGGSEQFIRFIGQELQPLIEKKYRVNSSRTLIGQSLGGLLATEILFKKPGLFENYIIISPSLWWDDESLLRYEVNGFTGVRSVYIGVGKEGAVMERVARELFDKIEAVRGTNTRLFFGFFERQNHGDALHLAVYDSFEKIFRE